MSRAELLTLFEEIVAVLESGSSPVEKVEHIEALMFEPTDVVDEGDTDPDENED